MSICSDYLHCNPENQQEYARDSALVFQKCNDCGIIWRSPDSVDITKNYDEFYFESKNYEKNRTHKIKKSGWLITLASRFNRNLTDMLEVGCSVGNTLEAARQLGIGHLGTDISQFAIDYCSSRGLNARKTTMEQLLEEGFKFDLVFMQHVLEHFPDPFDVLLKCNRLLRVNGLILILVPNSLYKRASRGRGGHRFYSMMGVGSEHFVYFNYQNLNKVLTVTGFEIKQNNYPLFLRGNDSAWFFLNRLFRRGLSFFRVDQEILIIARKSG